MKNVVKIPVVLIPRKGTDMSKWATIACDQFCERPKYWEELASYVGDAPSTLKITCPEIYLNNGNLDERIAEVWKTMNSYVADGLFVGREGFVLVEREVENGEKRVGVMISIDLDAYDWNRVRVPIRATEDTLVERLPVRIKIREKAPVESPHAIVLIDDPDKQIIEPLYAERDQMEKLYDFDLNMGGGHITGYAVNDSEALLVKLEGLLDKEVQTKKYGFDAGIMFAVGDGNHSIATAKVMWENLKKTLTDEEREGHPARYMLVEMVNLYGGGMDFKPIHRLIYTRDGNFASLTISAVQTYIESYAKLNKGFEVEYVHNEGHLKEAVDAADGIGIVMPDFPNAELVNFVVNVGNLPKKAFSIGEPEHKRYYLECKSIVR